MKVTTFMIMVSVKSAEQVIVSFAIIKNNVLYVNKDIPFTGIEMQIYSLNVFQLLRQWNVYPVSLMFR